MYVQGGTKLIINQRYALVDKDFQLELQDSYLILLYFAGLALLQAVCLRTQTQTQGRCRTDLGGGAYNTEGGAQTAIQQINI